MSTFKWFSSIVLATTMIPMLPAEAVCPGSVASVPLRMVNRYQMIVAVSLNNSGPYEFLLDTGTQITMIDVSLATALQLETHGTAVVAGVGSQSAASFSQLHQIAVGSHRVADQKGWFTTLRNSSLPIFTFKEFSARNFLNTSTCLSTMRIVFCASTRRPLCVRASMDRTLRCSHQLRNQVGSHWQLHSSSRHISPTG
jgi:hypothetical protein